ncbi:MAG: anti-sigma factor, partial [Roseiflexaceae bacterium]|nr:anti-sigma factor [Roseiflexaceae bacterium]
MTTNPLPQLNDTDLELLSAYIDRQLPDAERSFLEARLGQEPTLRAALNELRTTIAVLRALEPVRLPRSFTIDPATVRQSTRWWQALLLPFGGLAAVLLAAVVLV